MSPDDARGAFRPGDPRDAPGEANSQLAAESIRPIVWVVSADGTFEYVNGEGSANADHLLDTSSGGNWLSLVHHEDVERARRDWGQAVRTMSPCRLECRIRCADGEFHRHEIHRLPVRQPDARLAWIGIAIDIEDRSRLESDLRRSRRDAAEANRLLGTLQSSVPVGFAFVDRDFRIIRINETLAAINGAPIEQQIGQTVPEVVPNLWPQLERLYRHVLDTGESIVNMEVSREIKAEPGRPRHWLSSYYPVCIDQEVIGVVVVFIDVTERNKAVLARSTLFHALVAAMAATSEARDAYTAGHQRRVAQISVAIATEMGLQPDAVEGIRVAAELHDIGKISIPAEILTRPTKLGVAEFELVKQHSRVGYEITRGIPFPWPVADMILQHHERCDGSGYPDGIRGDQILIGARIIAVADVVEAMASHRPYRPGLGVDKALAEIERGRGTIYDANVAEACLRLFREKRCPLLT